jgi:cytochrome c-type biogenesis protein CcmH
MSTFTLLATLLVAASLAIILLPFLRGPVGGAVTSRRGTNLSVRRDQLAELERERDNGVLDQTQFERACADVERMAAEELLAGTNAVQTSATPGLGVAMLLAVALPAFALVWYGTADGFRAPGPDNAAAAAGGQSAGEPPHEDLASMTSKLEARLREDPNSVEGWFLLARTHHAAQRYDDAVTAYERARKLAPADADVLADYADTLAMAQGRKLAGKPAELLLQALAAKPEHPKALLLAGSAAFEAGDFRNAATYWERATRVTAAGTEFGDTARAALADARRRLGEPVDFATLGQSQGVAPAAAQPTTAASAGKPDSGASASTVEGSVKLAPALAAKAGPDDTVFVIARAVKGPPMPLAVKRFKVRDLPIKFSLSDADAMMPELTISKIGEIVVLARISRSGEPKAASGDLEAISAPLKAPQRDIALEISRVLP